MDWLAAAGQSWWQVLPLGPPDEAGSPYAASSAFAAWDGFLARPDAPSRQESERLPARNRFWIDDWTDAGGSLDDQVRFDREWSALRAYAAERGVRLIGDVPIYVAQGSVDHRAHPDSSSPGSSPARRRTSSARSASTGATRSSTGTPPRTTGYRWWIERLRRTLALFDLTRIDHFRGFAEFWAIPKSADARAGRWLPGPGAAVFEAAEAELGPCR